MHSRANSKGLIKIIGYIWGKIQLIMDGSVFFRAVDRIMAFIMRLFSGSVLVKFFGTNWAVRKFENSALVILFHGFFNALNRFGERYVVPVIEGSVFIGLVGRAAKRVRSSAYLKGSYFFSVFFASELGLPELGIVFVCVAAPFLPTMLIAVCVGFVLFCFLVKLTVTRGYRVAIDMCGVLLLIYLIITIYSALTSFESRSSLKIALLTTVFMLTYYLVLNLIDSVAKLQAFMFAFCTSAFVTGLYGMYQKLSGRVDTTWTDTFLFDIKLRVYSTFGNPNVYGEYLLLAIPFAILMIYLSKSVLMRVYYAIGATVLIGNLALTYSRGCYLALGLAAFVCILLMQKRLVSFFSIGIFAAPFVLPKSIISRLLSITNLADSSTSYRISIYRASVRIIRSFWFSGIGQGIDAFNTVYPLYGFNMVTAPHSHSLYLQVFVETGIVGFLVFLFFLAYFFKGQLAVFYLKKDVTPQARAIAAAFICAVVGFLFQGIFDYVFYNYKVLLMFFIVMGMGGAFVRLYGGRDVID